ncbi:MAG: hypothetical protein ACP5VE_00030, partial [Chthonomonadales bacterium]
MNSVLRYLGPRPYTQAEARHFAGRSEQATALISLLGIHRVVRLQGESGVGKTSLANAAITPLLQRDGADVLPCVRLAPLLPMPASVTGNPLLWRIFVGWCGDPQEASQWMKLGLARYLADRPKPSGFGVLPSLRVIVLDEGAGFPSSMPQQHLAELANQLQAAMAEDSLLRILHIADIPSAAGASRTIGVPLDAGAAFTLDPLTRAEALASVHQLAGAANVEITAEAASKLVGDLVTTKLRSAGTRVERIGEQVDPVHLQLAWRGAIRALHTGDTVVRMDHVAQVSEETLQLDTFCEEAVQHAAEAAGLSTQDLMRWIAHEFVDREGARMAVPGEGGFLRGLPYTAAEALATEGLLVKYVVAATDWFELGHDRLAPVIRALGEVAPQVPPVEAQPAQTSAP